MAKILFVLGGDDAEMLVIKQLLAQAGAAWVQPQQGWGEHKYSPTDLDLTVEETRIAAGGGHGYSSAYDRVGRRCAGIAELVFVECGPDEDFPAETPVVVVDHHGEHAGRPASVLQVLRHLEVAAVKAARRETIGSMSEPGAERKMRCRFEISPATRRWVELVAANDAGYIPAMVALGATAEEVERIRALDRSAQGVTPAHEREAERALGAAEVIGRLTVIRMDHSKTSPVTDRLFGRYDQLLVLSGDGEANFYGDGAVCTALKEKFEGWNGGSGLGKPGQNAFWGGYPSHEEVLLFLAEQF